MGFLTAFLFPDFAFLIPHETILKALFAKEIILIIGLPFVLMKSWVFTKCLFRISLLNFGRPKTDNTAEILFR